MSLLPSLAFLRYLLIMLPAVAGPFLEDIVSYPLYLFHTLLFFSCVRIREQHIPLGLQWVLLLAELAGCILLAEEYQGIMFLLFVSTLVSLFVRHNQAFRVQLSAMVWVAMNAVLRDSVPLELMLIANAMFLIKACLLFRSQRLEIRQEELQQLNDELRRKHYELEEARERIMEYARKVEDSAQAEERNRIARDIHDDLGHKLIRLKMMLEAVIHIMPTDPGKGMELVRQVRDQLTDSMETMRKTVRRLKPDESEIHSYSIDKLIEELNGDPGLTVDYRSHGMPYPLYPSCEIVLYRNAREAVTNAIRHGHADRVNIDIYYEEKQIILKVSNNGILPDSGSGSVAKGLGLSGMEERTSLLSGRVAIDWTDHYTVITTIPILRESDITPFYSRSENL